MKAYVEPERYGRLRRCMDCSKLFEIRPYSCRTELVHQTLMMKDPLWKCGQCLTDSGREQVDALMAQSAAKFAARLNRKESGR